MRTPTTSSTSPQSDCVGERSCAVWIVHDTEDCQDGRTERQQQETHRAHDIAEKTQVHNFFEQRKLATRRITTTTTNGAVWYTPRCESVHFKMSSIRSPRSSWFRSRSKNFDRCIGGVQDREHCQMPPRLFTDLWAHHGRITSCGDPLDQRWSELCPPHAAFRIPFLTDRMHPRSGRCKWTVIRGGANASSMSGRVSLSGQLDSFNKGGSDSPPQAGVPSTCWKRRSSRRPSAGCRSLEDLPPSPLPPPPSPPHPNTPETFKTLNTPQRPQRP